MMQFLKRFGGFFVSLPARVPVSLLERVVKLWEKIGKLQTQRERDKIESERIRKNNDLEYIHRKQMYQIEEEDEKVKSWVKKTDSWIEVVIKVEKLSLIQMDEQRKAFVTDGLLSGLLSMPGEEKQQELLPPISQSRREETEEGK